MFDIHDFMYNNSKKNRLYSVIVKNECLIRVNHEYLVISVLIF